MKNIDLMYGWIRISEGCGICTGYRHHDGGNLKSNQQDIHELKMIEDASEGCELSLSNDQKWLRLIVDGKLVVSFHVNYVNRILGNDKHPASPESKKNQETLLNP